MGLPFPPRERQPAYYYPIYASILMCCSIIGISVWIHHTEVMINHIEAALDAVGSVVGADNFFVLDQSVVATSVLFILYSAFMFGLCLWYCLLEAEVDVTGEVKDKVQLYQMANLGVRLCWWAVMTWLVVLLAGCAVFSVYVSNMHYMMEATLGNQALIPPPVVVPPFPDCPSTCVDLWVVDYIDVPKDRSCVCDTASLIAAANFLQGAKNAAPGSVAGVFMIYIVGGYWRSELSKQYAAMRKAQDVAGRLAAAAAGVGGGVASEGRGPPSGRALKSSGSGGYRSLPRGGGGSNVSSAGRPGGGPGRGRGRGPGV